MYLSSGILFTSGYSNVSYLCLKNVLKKGRRCSQLSLYDNNFLVGKTINTCAKSCVPVLRDAMYSLLFGNIFIMLSTILQRCSKK